MVGKKINQQELDVRFLRTQIDRFGSYYLSEVAAREQGKLLDNKQGYSETIWRLQSLLDMANGNPLAPDPAPKKEAGSV